MRLPTVSDLLFCAPTGEAQFALVVVHSIFWFFAVSHIGLKVVKPIIDTKPWQRQFALLNQRTYKNSMFVELELEDAYVFACVFVGVLTQHAVGGALCIPALCPFLGVPQHIATALACHGALCEVGWEVQDTLARMYAVLFTADGRKKNPTVLLVLLAVHHTLGLVMVVPMNLYYRDVCWYHEGVFLLQFAAAAALFAQSYGFTLDVSQARDLLQMKVCVTFVLVTIIYSRVVRYCYVGFQLVAHFRSVGDTRFAVCSSVGLGGMCVLNLLLFLDALGKFTKFIRMAPAKTPAQMTLLRSMSDECIASLSPLGPMSLSPSLSTAKKSWAQMRGVQALGMLRDGKSKGD